MNKTSFLVKEIDLLVRDAMHFFEDEGYLLPSIYLLTSDNEIFSMSMTVSDMAEEKAWDFNSFGRQVHERGLTPREAVFLRWDRFAANEHSEAQHAIVAIGRSADNCRFTQVVRPFLWDNVIGPIWLPIPPAQYEVARISQPVVGFDVLDCLFEAIPVSS